MLFGINRKFVIKVDDIALEGEFPLPKDDREIELEVARRLKYVPMPSIPRDTYHYEYICTLLNYTIKTRPKEIEDFAEIYQVQFVLDVYESYQKQKKTLDESLKKNNRTGSDRESPERSGDNSQSIPDEKLQSKARKIT